VKHWELEAYYPPTQKLMQGKTLDLTT